MNDYAPTSHSSAGSSPQSPAAQALRPTRRLLSRRTGGWIVAAGLTCAMVGLGAGSASAADPSPSALPAPNATVTPPGGGGARSGPADGGATGIVDSTSASTFTLSTATGVEVTVDEASSTTYTWGPLPVPPSIVRKGESVLVLGLVDTATISATQVLVQPLGDGGAAAAKASGVIAFQQGTPSPTKSVGQVPSDYTEGDGTIVSGTAADDATKAAQAVFPGGIVDRVVQLSDGEYEVHNISINWPHHVFVSKDFKVLGAE
jgi:cytochrome c-type biogenesis protein CcmE